MPGRILVIDDEEDMRILVADVLRKAGYDVAAPVDSYVALEQARAGRCDLIALNDEMPLLDGLAFLEVLREEGITTPVILLSDSTRGPDLGPFEALGVRHMIQKPFQVRQLLDLIADILPS